MEKTRKPDRRVLRTKNAIKNSFISLLIEKDMVDITIKDIADRADCDRKTVYNYYEGTFSILEEIENDFIQLLEVSSRQLDFKTYINDPITIFEKLTEILNENLDLYTNLMKLNSNSQLVSKMVQSIRLKIKEVLMESPLINKEYDLDLTALYITSGLIGIYQEWFNSDKSIPLSKISKQAGLLVYNGINGLKK
ncbi:MAG: TetR/AcrR family transcriptional regulator [Acholeplasmatales bacterium]|nr:TetR/AcrR family transcriptional regulator [Acholeplasmatales bacterium]